MSIARRIAELYDVKMNAALDRAADPRELVDYTYVQLQELLAEVRRGTVQVAASRKRAESRVSDLRRAAGRLSEQAEQVVLSMQLGGVGDAQITGAVPKAASLHDLRCAPGPPGRWSCGITIDVQKGDEAPPRG